MLVFFLDLFSNSTLLSLSFLLYAGVGIVSYFLISYHYTVPPCVVLIYISAVGIKNVTTLFMTFHFKNLISLRKFRVIYTLHGHKRKKQWSLEMLNLTPLNANPSYEM